MMVLIIGTYDENGNPDAMNAAWGGTYDYKQITISLSEHKTTDNLKKKGAFTVAFATKDTVTVSDYVGIVSASDHPDKMANSGLTALPSKNVDAPIFQEYPMVLECKVNSFENGTLIGDIVNISVDERILTDGKIDPSKAEFISYDPVNHKYLLIGEAVGNAFKDGLKLK